MPNIICQKTAQNIRNLTQVRHDAETKGIPVLEACTPGALLKDARWDAEYHRSRWWTLGGGRANGRRVEIG